jgi:SAM-dependent methyltransferase
MEIRSALCFWISRRLLSSPAQRNVDYKSYQDWRSASLSNSWSAFDDSDVLDKEVLDFGCGDGALSMLLASTKHPRRVIGVDLDPRAIERALTARTGARLPADVQVEFRVGSDTALPIADKSIDTLLAFDCLEHVMSPLPIFKDWYRVLRPGGKCLIEWFPFKGPWGPHMESLIPIPWAHVVFGQEALFRAAERIYDDPKFVPRHWDLDESGKKKPNKWRAWSSFKEQGYINELDLAGLRRLVQLSGLQIVRIDKRSFGGSALRRFVGRLLMSMPILGEHFLSFAIIELRRPAND